MTPHSSPNPLELGGNQFSTTVEVVPPPGPDAGDLLRALEALAPLPIGGFSVATNPVARPRMSALALSGLIQRHTGRSACMHCTTRDHNRLSLQALLWGARALGIGTGLCATGDLVALGDRARTTTIRDLDVFGLVRMAREAGLHTGVVLDPHPESGSLQQAVRRLERKVQAGAQFAVTQPLYDPASAQALARATQRAGIPVVLGILPLRSARHAEFLHHRVDGIVVPDAVRQQMGRASNPVAEGTAQARAMLALARDSFAGACIMPPFNHYEILFDILASEPSDRPAGLFSVPTPELDIPAKDRV